MAIEINGQGSPNIQNLPRKTGNGVEAETGQAGGAGERAAAGKGDTVSLSNTAENLKNLEQVITQLPVVDEQRVESIRQAINEGTYQVDSASIADRLINFESDLYR